MIGLFINSLFSHMLNGSAPYVAFVLSKSGGAPVMETSRMFIDEIKANLGKKGFLKLSDKKKVKVIIEDDGGSIEKNISLIKRLASDDNCIAIVGNASSTLSKNSLDILIASSNPPALIMPMATAPFLTNYAVKNNYPYLLRMAPSDDISIKSISKFISKQSSNDSVLIFGDRSNKVYSEYILEKLTDRLISKNIDVRCSILLGNPSYISKKLFNDIVGSKNICIVYAGPTKNALALLNQIEPLDDRNSIIFTYGHDWSLTDRENIQETCLNSASKDGIKMYTLSKNYKNSAKDTLTLLKIILSKTENISKEKFRAMIRDEKESIGFEGELINYSFEPEGENRCYEIDIDPVPSPKICVQLRKGS